MIGEIESNWQQIIVDLVNLDADHRSLGGPAALVSRYNSLASSDQHFVAAYERFAERLVNSLDQVMRKVALVSGGDEHEVDNLKAPALLRSLGALSGVKDAASRLEEAAKLRIDLQHHYGAVRARELYSVVEDLCQVMPEVLRALRPRLLEAGVKLPPLLGRGARGITP